MTIVRKPIAPTADHADRFIRGGAVKADTSETTGKKAVVNMKFDPRLLARVDAAAKQLGITRTAYVHIAVAKALEG
jgi:hypothetical protein